MNKISNATKLLQRTAQAFITSHLELLRNTSPQHVFQPLRPNRLIIINFQPINNPSKSRVGSQNNEHLHQLRMAQHLHRIPDCTGSVSVGCELLINNTQNYPLAISPGTLTPAHARGCAVHFCDLFVTKVVDFSNGKVDVVFVFCTEGGCCAEDNELLLALTYYGPNIVLLCPIGGSLRDGKSYPV